MARCRTCGSCSRTSPEPARRSWRGCTCGKCSGSALLAAPRPVSRERPGLDRAEVAFLLPRAERLRRVAGQLVAADPHRSQAEVLVEVVQGGEVRVDRAGRPFPEIGRAHV